VCVQCGVSVHRLHARRATVRMGVCVCACVCVPSMSNNLSRVGVRVAIATYASTYPPISSLSGVMCVHVHDI
jgi:hypothetical protein